MANLNGDAYPDLVTANTNDNSVSVLLGDGSGFDTKVDTALATGSGPSSIAVADVGGTNALDLVVTNANNHTIDVLEGDGSGVICQRHQHL